jgi:hypothetical protein
MGSRWPADLKDNGDTSGATGPPPGLWERRSSKVVCRSPRRTPGKNRMGCRANLASRRRFARRWQICGRTPHRDRNCELTGRTKSAAANRCAAGRPYPPRGPTMVRLARGRHAGGRQACGTDYNENQMVSRHAKLLSVPLTCPHGAPVTAQPPGVRSEPRRWAARPTSSTGARLPGRSQRGRPAVA